ncbi:unnamed protein product [Polarella glacialis]|uniref:AB hydrolase-1 domain-containing protein n=2 Tax=Polarella glacialis TaxID=89957 RepID=A0A813G117_POLGL|nr:unnamed protein product [Polarella glacialis]
MPWHRMIFGLLSTVFACCRATPGTFDGSLHEPFDVASQGITTNALPEVAHTVSLGAEKVEVSDTVTSWARPWRMSWVNVTIQNRTYAVRTRRLGHGPTQLFCVQGGPGGLYWDLNFLAVYLDMSRYEIIQYDPLGSKPSPCFWPDEECYADHSWMTVEGFVSTMDQVHQALEVSSNAVIVAHSFGVVCTLEFLLRWPSRVRGAVLSDWVASQSQAAARLHWCEQNVNMCRAFKPSLREPWREEGNNNHILGHVFWGPHGNGSGGILETWDVRSKLHMLQHIPTLTFAGDYDIIFATDALAMSQALQGDYVHLSDAGHFSFVDRRSAWLAAFEQWVDQIPVTRGINFPSKSSLQVGSVLCPVAIFFSVLFGICFSVFKKRPTQLQAPLLVSGCSS